MSFTIDDLVASLSTNHIGQEALDLAALQAQLAQSLYTSTDNASANYSKQGHYNSPIARTPSSSFSWSDGSGPGEVGCTRTSRSSGIIHRQRQNSIDEQAYYYNGDIDESDEDEQMVEDLLYPSSSVSSGTPSTPASTQFLQYGFPSSGASGYHNSPPSSPKFHSDSQFATTDPFYLAQLQMQREQAQNAFSSTSFFSQMGKPNPHSPFSQSQQQPQYHYGHHQQYSACEVDHHSHQQPMLVGAVSFDR